MKKFKEVETRTIINEDMKVETRTKTTLHIIRTWGELTKEEKEQEIKDRHESIYQCYQEDLYFGFQADMEYFKEKYKNIDFENVYMDGNSQGNWIDSIKGFRYCGDAINIYNEWVEIEDIDLHIRKYIENFDININDYYIDSEKIEKIKNTKKYKKWIKNIEEEITNWIQDINSSCKYIMDREYCYPCDLDNTEDKEYLDMYFENEEFETIEVLENE